MDRSKDAYWKVVHAHIDALLDLPIEEHDAYLNTNCKGAPMRRDVKSWLAYIYSPSDVLDESVATYAQTLLADYQPPERPPLWSNGPPKKSSSATASNSSSSNNASSLNGSDRIPSSAPSHQSPDTPSSNRAPRGFAQPPWIVGITCFVGVCLLWWFTQ